MNLCDAYNHINSTTGETYEAFRVIRDYTLRVESERDRAKALAGQMDALLWAHAEEITRLRKVLDVVDQLSLNEEIDPIRLLARIHWTIRDVKAPLSPPEPPAGGAA